MFCPVAFVGFTLGEALLRENTCSERAAIIQQTPTDLVKKLAAIRMNAVRSKLRKRPAGWPFRRDRTHGIVPIH